MWPPWKCGACGGAGTRCIWHEETLGASCTFETYEYVCRECGKYSVYHYED